MIEKCPCFYPELDPVDETETLCNCGHAMDEHDDDGECTIEEEL